MISSVLNPNSHVASGLHTTGTQNITTSPIIAKRQISMCLHECVESKVNACFAVKTAKTRGVKDTNSGVPEAELWVALFSFDLYKAYPLKVLGGHMASNHLCICLDRALAIQ